MSFYEYQPTLRENTSILTRFTALGPRVTTAALNSQEILWASGVSELTLSSAQAVLSRTAHTVMFCVILDTPEDMPEWNF